VTRLSHRRQGFMNCLLELELASRRSACPVYASIHATTVGRIKKSATSLRSLCAPTSPGKLGNHYQKAAANDPSATSAKLPDDRYPTIKSS
jgi:hypothetical protein